MLESGKKGGVHYTSHLAVIRKEASTSKQNQYNIFSTISGSSMSPRDEQENIENLSPKKDSFQPKATANHYQLIRCLIKKNLMAYV